MKHFLLLQLKSVCYRSYTYFSDSLANALAAMGHQITVFSVENEPFENIERFIGQSFDGIFDFNSDLPKCKMDDDSYFLDHIDAPFYDIILDHPLYHHDMLKQPLKNFHVLCLDTFHKTYIETYYPHISSVHVWAMTGEDIAEGNPSYPNKDIDLLFTGSYTDYRQVADALEKCPHFLGSLSLQLIQKMQNDPQLPQEEALRQMLPSLDAIVEETFPLHMQACFLCDSWLRAWRREQILTALADANLPLTLCGNGFHTSPLAAYPNVTILEEIPFQQTFALFRRSRLTLNCMPNFCNGTHDRIYSAMLNHSLCLTDTTPLLAEQFTDKKELCFYDVQNIPALVETVRLLLSSPSLVETITQAGYQNAKEKHTWESHAASLQYLSVL